MLVDALHRGVAVDIAIFDDCSEWEKDWGDTNLDRVKVLRNPEHRGKEGFYKTYQDIFNYCKEHEYDYYVILPDDVVPCDNFIMKAIMAYNDAPGCISMCPLVTNRSIAPGISRWGRKPILRTKQYYVTHYFDCCAIVRRDFFEALDWVMYRIEPSTNPYRSSGVGKQITERLQQKNKMMCHVRRTLLSTTEDDSQMNRQERERHPMYANVEDNKDCVDMYMASLWRDGHVIETIKSLLRQPELKTLTVVLNNYTDIQAIEVLKALEQYDLYKVKLVRGDNAKCSNEKLHYISNGTAKYFAFADDDLIYPEDYLMKLIAGCNVHNAAVSLHGGRIKQFPTDKYYNGGRKMYSWNRLLKEDTKVDIIGNGVALYKRAWFTPEELAALYKDAPTVSMDDIIMSCTLANMGIDRYVLAHGPRLVQHKPIKPTDNYVYDQYKNSDLFQVGYINTHLTRDMLVDKHTS